MRRREAFSAIFDWHRTLLIEHIDGKRYSIFMLVLSSEWHTPHHSIDTISISSRTNCEYCACRLTVDFPRSELCTDGSLQAPACETEINFVSNFMTIEIEEVTWNTIFLLCIENIRRIWDFGCICVDNNGKCEDENRIFRKQKIDWHFSPPSHWIRNGLSLHQAQTLSRANRSSFLHYSIST